MSYHLLLYIHFTKITPVFWLMIIICRDTHFGYEFITTSGFLIFNDKCSPMCKIAYTKYDDLLLVFLYYWIILYDDWTEKFI